MQATEQGGLSRCKQLFEVAAALRASLYARAQSLQLLQAPFAMDPVDLSLLGQPDDPVPSASDAASTGWPFQACLQTRSVTSHARFTACGPELV